MEIIKELELQFEYKIMTYYGLMEEAVTQDILKKKNTSSEDVLNELGKDGWELFSILQGKDNCLFIFKRSKWVENKAQEEQEDNTNKFEPKPKSCMYLRYTPKEREKMCEDRKENCKYNPTRQADIDIPFGAKDSELQEASYHIPEGFHAEIQGDKVVIKKGKNPSWSEADKDFMYDTLSNLTELKYRYGEGYGNVGKCIDWLQSIKNRIKD